MENVNQRTTVYFESELHHALKVKSLETSRSVSDLVNEAVRNELRYDAEDLKIFEDRKDEATISFESLVKKLKADGKI